MSRRMIDTSLFQNEKFSRMPLGARMLQIGIITYADDQGRAKANPSFLRMQIFPDDEDVTNADVQKWLGLMVKNGTVMLYTVDEKQYVQLLNWWKYQSLQYAAPSQFPRPDGWKDRIRKTVTKGFIATCNWLTVDGTQLDDTCDQDGQPLPKKPTPKPSTPPTSSQSPNGSAPIQEKNSTSSTSYSPESTGGHSGESLPERTIELNRTELNRTETTTTTAPPQNETQAKAGSGGGSLPTMRNRQTDADFARLCTKFESEGFGTLTQIMGEDINALLNEFPVDWIDEAMTVSVQANKRQLRYVRGILVKWRSDGRNDRKPSQNGQAPPPQLLTLKQWCLKTYHVDNPKFANVPEATIHEQYNQYRSQQAH